MNTPHSNNAKERAVQNFLKIQNGQLSVSQFVAGIRNGEIKVLAKAITLLESTHPQHAQLASEIIRESLPYSGKSIRIGITGVPGVGKSTFIEAFGMYLNSLGLKTAVLAIDPSSNVNKGSILGDKTRMENLSANPLSFVRPSPSSGALGGVANATRESILLCEAAGFEVIIVETVGVGQSEYLVRDMVDFFLLLMLPGAGDEIQGIKRGIMEMADALVVNKADGTNERDAQNAAQNYRNALHLFPLRSDLWTPVTQTCSAIEHRGMDEIWNVITQFKEQQFRNGWFEKRRQNQAKTWLMEQVQFGLKKMFFENSEVKKNLDRITGDVVNGYTTPYAGSQELLNLYLNSIQNSKT